MSLAPSPFFGNGALNPSGIRALMDRCQKMGLCRRPTPNTESPTPHTELPPPVPCSFQVRDYGQIRKHILAIAQQGEPFDLHTCHIPLNKKSTFHYNLKRFMSYGWIEQHTAAVSGFSGKLATYKITPLGQGVNLETLR